MPNYLEHYGVKGMKWGVRRTPEQLGHKRSSSKDISMKTWTEIQRIHNSLSKHDKRYLGNMMVSKYTAYAKTKNGAYITLDDYGGDYRDEHPHRGKIISIAASKNSRGTGATDSLIQRAVKDNPNDILIAEIDHDNIASQRLFSRNGFLLIDKTDSIFYYALSPNSNATLDVLKKHGNTKL